MRNFIKASLTVLSFAAGVCLMTGLAHKAGAASIYAPDSTAPIMIPEVTIYGSAPKARDPQAPMVKAPSKMARKARHRSAPTGGVTVREHSLHQGGSPEAPSVVYWDTGR